MKYGMQFYNCLAENMKNGTLLLKKSSNFTQRIWKISVIAIRRTVTYHTHGAKSKKDFYNRRKRKSGKAIYSTRNVARDVTCENTKILRRNIMSPPDYMNDIRNDKEWDAHYFKAYPHGFT